MVALIVWQALKEHIDPSRGQKMFIPADSVIIRTFAIQLADQHWPKV